MNAMFPFSTRRDFLTAAGGGFGSLAMASKTNVHGPASYMQNTGFTLPGFPAMGAWISYALGSLKDNLPAFVVLPDPRGLPYNNQGNFTSGFLPVKHAGTIIRPHLP